MNKKSSKISDGAPTKAKKLGTEFLGEMPLGVTIRATSDSGWPIVLSEPDSPHARVYKEIAMRIWRKLSGAEKRAPRIVVQ